MVIWNSFQSFLSVCDFLSAVLPDFVQCNVHSFSFSEQMLTYKSQNIFTAVTGFGHTNQGLPSYTLKQGHIEIKRTQV